MKKLLFILLLIIPFVVFGQGWEKTYGLIICLIIIFFRIERTKFKKREKEIEESLVKCMSCGKNNLFPTGHPLTIHFKKNNDPTTWTGDIYKCTYCDKPLLDKSFINGVKTTFYTKDVKTKLTTKGLENISVMSPENVSIKTHTTFKKGMKEGSYKSYYKEEVRNPEGLTVGQLKSDGYYKNDKKDGFWKYYHENIEKIEIGKIWKEENYKYGKLISKKCWDENGNEIECK